MTTTTTTDQPKLNLGGGDPVAKLTVGELSELSQKIKTDVVSAITDKTDKRWDALALVGWALERRERGKEADLAAWRAMTSEQLAEALGLNAKGAEDDDQDDDGLDPTVPTPSP